MSTLLLLSLFLFPAGGAGMSTPSAEAPIAADGSPMMPSQARPEPSGINRIQINDSTDRDQVCLNIHAFIFKTEDDRVPKLVRETTCLPASAAGAKKANENVQPKLVPATSGNH